MLTAFEAFFRAPRSAEVYNLGGGRHSNTSHLEAFAHRRGDHRPRDDRIEYVEPNRIGDHQWWIS